MSNRNFESAESNARRLRVVTYNIHKGIGGIDRTYRLERVIETLRQHSPELMLLQEVDDGVPRSNLERQVDVIANELGLQHSSFQRNVKVRQGHYGNAILSRYPLTNVEHLDLTIRFKKRRRALLATCNIGEGTASHQVAVVNFHLGLAGFERRIQINRVLESDTMRSLQQKESVIVGGDCNDFTGALFRRIMKPAGFQSAGHSIQTFPAIMPLAKLDYLYYRGEIRATSAFACRSKVARAASDHLPLIADFEILEQGDSTP